MKLCWGIIHLYIRGEIATQKDVAQDQIVRCIVIVKEKMAFLWNMTNMNFWWLQFPFNGSVGSDIYAGYHKNRGFNEFSKAPNTKTYKNESKKIMERFS